jgi:hypothetical protein
MKGYTMFIPIKMVKRIIMETTHMEPEREARLDKALRLLSNRDYLDNLVCERFNAVYRNLDFG